MHARIFLAVLLALPVAAQDPVARLAKHAIPMRTLDIRDDDFRDLEPLRAKLAGVRVVMLGEQSHGDGTAFVAKARLVRFLHERMGFDVLAFESGLYDCAKGWERLREGEPAREAIPRAVFPIWSNAVEVQPLIDYLGVQAKGRRPLELAGVDSQLTGTTSNDFLEADLAAYLARIDPRFAKGEEWNRVAGVIRKLATSVWEIQSEPIPPVEEREAFVRTIERWQAAIAARDKSPATRPWSGAFWRQFLVSLRAFAEQTWRTPWPDHTADAEVFAMRDRQMGENLIWLATQRYPKRKIIVWGATFHNARNLRTIETSDPKYTRLYAATSPMGEVAWRALGRKLYSLGFTSYEGESGRAFGSKVTPLPAASPGSFEDLCARAGLTNAIVDFRGASWLREPLEARLLGHVEMRADWAEVVDGVVFLRRMERAHKAAK